MEAITALSLAGNVLALALAAAFVRRKGGVQFLKSKLAARGIVRDRALERFEDAYRRTRVELFERFPPTPGSLVLLGDSLTDLGPWRELLGIAELRNQGISGDTAPGVLARLDAVAAAGTVVLLIGINDLNGAQTPRGLLADVTRILDGLAAMPARPRVIVQSLLPIDHHVWGVAAQAKVREYNPLLERLARERGLAFLDLYPLFLKGDKLDPACTHDGLHVNATGYERWRDALKPML